MKQSGDKDADKLTSVYIIDIINLAFLLLFMKYYLNGFYFIVCRHLPIGQHVFALIMLLFWGRFFFTNCFLKVSSRFPSFLSFLFLADFHFLSACLLTLFACNTSLLYLVAWVVQK